MGLFVQICHIDSVDVDGHEQHKVILISLPQYVVKKVEMLSHVVITIIAKLGQSMTLSRTNHATKSSSHRMVEVYQIDPAHERFMKRGASSRAGVCRMTRATNS